MTPKQTESLREGLRRNVRMGADIGDAQDTVDALRDLLRRDWAVRVLDAFALHCKTICPSATPGPKGSCSVYVTGYRKGGKSHGSWVSPAWFNGDGSAESARLAAAEAVLGDLPEATRRELGEKP